MMFPGPDSFLFTIVPLLIGAIFVVVIGVIVFRLFRVAAEWSSNNRQPVQALPATVRAKRTDVRGIAGDMDGTRTDYYVTFEYAGGARLELRVKAKTYGLLAEGDTGTLSIQGTRFLGFDRNVRAVAQRV